jgi:hypothetical protein
VAGFRIDADLVDGYARDLRRAAETLELAARVPEAGGVTADAVGAAGRELGVHEAYQRAATSLCAQLHDGSEALSSASDALGDVVRKHSGGDDDRADEICRAGRL